MIHLKAEEVREELRKAEKAIEKVCDQTEVRSVFHQPLFDILIRIRGMLWPPNGH